MSNVEDVDGRLGKLVDHADEFGISLISALELHEDCGFFVERYALVLLSQVLGLGKERLLNVLSTGGAAQCGANAGGHLTPNLAKAPATGFVRGLHLPGHRSRRQRT